MQLTMWIIADRLKEYNPRTFIQSNEFEITSVRLFTDNFSQSSGTLYVGKVSDFFENEEDYIICAHNNDMITLECCNLEEVFNCILNAIDYYNNWNDQMLYLLTHGAMQQDLFDATQELLSIPAFLLDAGQRLLAYTKSFPVGSVDYVWDQMLLKGSANVEILMDLNSRYPERFSEKSCILRKPMSFPTTASIKISFCRESGSAAQASSFWTAIWCGTSVITA